MPSFLRVFGDIAVKARAEKLHFAALRRQRSEVRIFSGTPIFSMAYPKTYLATSSIRSVDGRPLVLDRDMAEVATWTF